MSRVWGRDTLTGKTGLCCGLQECPCLKSLLLYEAHITPTLQKRQLRLSEAGAYTGAPIWKTRVLSWGLPPNPVDLGGDQHHQKKRDVRKSGSGPGSVVTPSGHLGKVAAPVFVMLGSSPPHTG